MICPDRKNASLNAEALVDSLAAVMRDPPRLADMQSAAEAIHLHAGGAERSAADEIARWMLDHGRGNT